MSNIRLSGKLFFKSVFLPIITFFGVGVLFALLIKKFIYETTYRYDSGYLSQLTQVTASQKYAFYFFILFLFLSYEFISKAKLANAEETIFAAVAGAGARGEGVVVFREQRSREVSVLLNRVP